MATIAALEGRLNEKFAALASKMSEQEETQQVAAGSGHKGALGGHCGPLSLRKRWGVPGRRAQGEA
jgi:hypothetical protein